MAVIDVLLQCVIQHWAELPILLHASNYVRYLEKRN